MSEVTKKRNVIVHLNKVQQIKGELLTNSNTESSAWGSPYKIIMNKYRKFQVPAFQLEVSY